MKENISNNSLHNNYGDGFQTHRCNRFVGYLKLITICFVLLMVSCKAKKQLVAKRAPIDSNAAAVNNKVITLNAVRAAQTSFDAFSGKARTRLDISGSSNDVTLNIRIKRNQKIWISITAIAGIEVARALITPDSILVINRLQSLYIKKPFSYINTVAGKQVNYKTIESVLVGNAIPELINENAALQTKPDSITLIGNLQGLLYKLIIGPGMKAAVTSLNDNEAGQSMLVTNDTFIQVGTRVVPSQINITTVVKDKKIQVNLHYVKSEFDEQLEYPFNIPARYKEGN